MAKKEIVGDIMGIPVTRKQAEKMLSDQAKKCLYPDVKVCLSNGVDGNAFGILGVVQKALRNAGHVDAVAVFMNEATSGDYNHLLRTCMKYVNVS